MPGKRRIASGSSGVVKAGLDPSALTADYTERHRPRMKRQQCPRTNIPATHSGQKENGCRPEGRQPSTDYLLLLTDYYCYVPGLPAASRRRRHTREGEEVDHPELAGDLAIPLRQRRLPAEVRVQIRPLVELEHPDDHLA